MDLAEKRIQLRTKLTRFSNFLDSLREDPTKIIEIPSRLSKIEPLYDEFETIQGQIESSADGVYDEATRSNFENRYHSLIACAQGMIKEKSQSISSANDSQLRNASQSVQVRSAKCKLPVIDVPKFNGNWDKWLTFRDTFTSMVHDDEALDNISKLLYLRWALSGEALKMIENLEIIGDNYSIAWSNVKERYDNNKIIVQQHTQALISLPGINKESYGALQQFLNAVQQHTQTLERLKQPVKEWSTLLLQVLLPKLDPITRRLWETERAKSEELPSFQEFDIFLRNRCKILEALQTPQNYSHNMNAEVMKQRNFSHFVANPGDMRVACSICKQDHKLVECQAFREMSVQERFDVAKRSGLCFNCLKPFHGKNCRVGTCKKCGRAHNTLLHFESRGWGRGNANTAYEEVSPQTSMGAVEAEQQSVQTSPRENQASLTATSGNSSQILLSTALVQVFDSTGKAFRCRALLDSGSQVNFMSQELQTRLGLKEKKGQTHIVGIGQSASRSLGHVHTRLGSCINTFSRELKFLVMGSITSRLPERDVDLRHVEVPSNIVLADPDFNKAGKIDLLLGAGIFWDLLSVGQIRMSRAQPVFQKTILGWIISGQIELPPKDQNTVRCNMATLGLDEQLEKFWSIEEVSSKKFMTDEEQACEDHFVSTHYRNAEGRFVVRLPFKDNVDGLGDSLVMAKRRFSSLERKFERNETLKIQYSQSIREYIESGKMSMIHNNLKEAEEDTSLSYYLPHHAVFKEESTTTKLRVVCDASAKSSSNLSLNDVLKTGPTIQEDLFSIVTRFRQHAFALSADIASMYHQVEVDPVHRSFQRLLWRFSSSEPIRIYELNRVTFGQASSSFLATRALQQVVLDTPGITKQIAEAIQRDFYVDDFISGSDDLERASTLKKGVAEVLGSAKFDLRKWKSNVPELSDGNDENSTVRLGEKTKVLGLLWNTEQDVLGYEVSSEGKKKAATKRQILASVAQVYDPLGLVGPVMISAKIILQSLWSLKMGWDETLPQQITAIWRDWVDKVHLLNEIRVPRRIVCEKATSVELHGFCDASEAAYGACIYVRSTNEDQKHQVQLLCSKSRVAPLKKISLPRLELCSALLLARLFQSVTGSLTLPISSSHFWSDSMIALAWIRGHPSRWHTFVANRVSEIQEITREGRWQHVASEENPADILSRGLEANHFKEAIVWWQGPGFLSGDYEQDEISYIEPEDMPEAKKTLTCATATAEDDFEIFARYSSYSRIQRVVAYCLRFIEILRNKKVRQIQGPLTLDELNESKKRILRIAQRESFEAEIRELKKSQQVSTSSKISDLMPFLDNEGLIRVGGRLRNSTLEYGRKFPIILSGCHPLTELIIRAEHLKNMHLGPSGLLAIIRSEFWPISGQSTVKRVLRKCLACFRARPRAVEQLMGNLPPERIEPAMPFTNTGVDYAGSFCIKISRNVTGKAYLCLFVCFSTKAVHLEIVSDLSTAAFMNSLKRFVARRGKCSRIFSDNGTNFVGAFNEIKDLGKLINRDHTQIEEFLAKEGIKWSFIPPGSPHMGGLWESAVKSCKSHLKKVIGEVKLTFEELSTVITQIEAILNSRPLSELSADPNDLEPLTPGHFLIGRPLAALPEPDYVATPTNRLQRYNMLAQMRQIFWKRWSVEYVAQLQQRKKWKCERPNVKVGALVLIKDPNVPPLNWKMGRIAKVFMGADNLVRVVDIKTSNGIIKRSLAKICIMPVE